MNARTWLVAVTVTAWGCGKSTTAPAAAGLGTATCTATLSGTFTGSYDCHPATAAWASSGNLGGFAFTVAPSASQPDIIVSVAWPGAPAVHTYASTDSGAQGVVELMISPGLEWLAAVGGADSAQGSYALTLTNVSDSVATAQGKAYLVAGTLTAKLPAVAASGAAGAITITATF